MKRWARDAAAVLVIAAIPVLAGCGTGGEAPSYRYRMTVVVDTPAGLRSGSGVIEVQPRLKGEYAADMAVDGEAVPIDLPNGRTLYTLLRSGSTEDWAGWIVLWLVRTPALANATMADTVRAAATTQAVLTLPATFPAGAGYPLAGTDAMPTFVTFADPRRPGTVRIVEADAFAATFGPGTTLRRITFKVTNDPVSDGLRDRLPWLATQRGSLVPATIQSPPEQRALSAITNAAFELSGF